MPIKILVINSTLIESMYLEQAKYISDASAVFQSLPKATYCYCVHKLNAIKQLL